MTETNTSPETGSSTKKAKRSVLGNWWVQRLAVSFLIFCAVAGWFVYRRGLWFLYPRLGSFDSIRRDDTPARRLAEELGLPELPDLTRLDEAGAKHFYTALYNLRRFPKTAEQYGVLGKVYEAQGSREQAVEVYRRAIAFGDEDYQWHYHLAFAAQQLGQAEVTRPELERTIELNPAYAPAYMRLGSLLLAAGELDKAEKMFNAYLARRPSDALGYLALGRLARERGDWQGVVAHVAAAPEPGKAGHQLLGVAYHKLGESEKAETHLRLVQSASSVARMEDPLEAEMLKLQTSETIVHDRYEFLSDQGRYREALPLAKQLVEKTRGTPEHAGAWATLAECHRHLEEYDQALKAVAQALHLDPMQPEPHVIHGMVRLAVGDLVRALIEGEEAVKLRDSYLPGRYLRAQALFRLSDQNPIHLRQAGVPYPPAELLQRAIADFRYVVQVEPTNYEALFHLAYVLAMEDNYDEAVTVFERADEIRPGQEDLAKFLAAAKARDASAFGVVRSATRPADQSGTQPSIGPASGMR